jgi:hypothetical protein
MSFTSDKQICDRNSEFKFMNTFSDSSRNGLEEKTELCLNLFLPFLIAFRLCWLSGENEGREGIAEKN